MRARKILCVRDRLDGFSGRDMASGAWREWGWTSERAARHGRHGRHDGRAEDYGHALLGRQPASGGGVRQRLLCAARRSTCERLSRSRGESTPRGECQPLACSTGAGGGGVERSADHGAWWVAKMLREYVGLVGVDRWFGTGGTSPREQQHVDRRMIGEGMRIGEGRADWSGFGSSALGSLRRRDFGR
jgi:hypothetical protein